MVVMESDDYARFKMCKAQGGINDCFKGDTVETSSFEIMDNE